MQEAERGVASDNGGFTAAAPVQAGTEAAGHLSSDDRAAASEANMVGTGDVDEWIGIDNGAPVGALQAGGATAVATAALRKPAGMKVRCPLPCTPATKSVLGNHVLTPSGACQVSVIFTLQDRTASYE